MPSPTPKSEELKIIAGDVAVLARRYGGALFDLAKEAQQLDEIAADIRTLRNLLDGSKEFETLSTHPRLARGKLVETIKKITTSANLNKLTGNFLALVAQRRRLNILGPIVDAFLAELAHHRGEMTAIVQTARPLSAAQQDQLTAKLHELVGGKISLDITEDATLLGGLTVKIGSRLIDASVKTKLLRLERQLKSTQGPSEKAA